MTIHEIRQIAATTAAKNNTSRSESWSAGSRRRTSKPCQQEQRSCFCQ